MKRGKRICSQLKAIRRQIAQENDIPLEISDCTYEGECRGTCPRCESEVRYLESELSRRAHLGMAVTVAGIALTLNSCDRNLQPEQPANANSSKDTMMLSDTTPANSTVTPRCLADKIDKEDAINLDELAIEGGCDDEDVLPGMVEEEVPEYPGGYEALSQFLQNNIKYPEKAKKAGIEGRVYVSFSVDTDGTISDIKLLRDIGGGCGEEAIRVVKLMPKWTPGKMMGKVTKTHFTLPINFELPKNNDNNNQ